MLQEFVQSFKWLRFFPESSVLVFYANFSEKCRNELNAMDIKYAEDKKDDCFDDDADDLCVNKPERWQFHKVKACTQFPTF